MASGNRIYDVADKENISWDLPDLKYAPPPKRKTASKGASALASLPDKSSSAKVEPRSSAAGGPVYTATDEAVGSAEPSCPAPEDGQTEQRLIEIIFTDENGEAIERVGDKQSVRVVIRSENMSGETLILELKEQLGLPKLNGRVVKPSDHIRIPITADAFYIRIDLVPTIVIYTDGKISRTDLSTATRMQFVYKDANSTFHDLLEHDVILAQKWNRGYKEKSSAPKGAVEKVADGKSRWFGKNGKNQTPLVNPFAAGPDLFIYDTAPVKIHLHYNQGGRPYYNPEAIACVFGALAEARFTDVVSNGSTGADGTGAPSISHVNGFNSDMKYLRTDKLMANIDYLPDTTDAAGKIVRKKAGPILVSDILLDVDRQNALNDALAKFGFNSMLSHYYQVPKKPKTADTEAPAAGAKPAKPKKPVMVDKLLKHCSADSGHKDHLHIQGFKANYQTSA